jgi:hypothetical protein
MEETTKAVAFVCSAIALGLQLRPGVFERIATYKDTVAIAILQRATAHIRGNTPRISNRSCNCTTCDRTFKPTSGNTQRPTRPANLIRGLDWQHDMADWYFQQQEKGRLIKGEPTGRVPDRYTSDARLVVTESTSRLLTQARALAPSLDLVFKENSGKRLLRQHPPHQQNAPGRIWRDAGCPGPQPFKALLQEGHYIWNFPDHALVHPILPAGSYTAVNQPDMPWVFGSPNVHASPGFIDYAAAKANRKRLTRLRTREAQREWVPEPVKHSQWLSNLERRGFKAGLPREHKPKSEKLPRVTSRVALPFKIRTYRVDSLFQKPGDPTNHIPCYTICSPTLAPVKTRYVPCAIITLMESVLNTDPETGDVITIENVGLNGDTYVS